MHLFLFGAHSQRSAGIADADFFGANGRAYHAFGQGKWRRRIA